MDSSKLLCSLLLLFYTYHLSATVCVDQTFEESKVRLYLCQNHTGYSETRSLLFKARTKVINEYVEQQIVAGIWPDKKLEIQVYDPVLTFTHLHLTHGPEANYVSLSAYPNLEQLITIVNYFPPSKGHSFVTGQFPNEDSSLIQYTIDQFYKLNTPEKKLRPGSFAVWQLEGFQQNDLKLQYVGDSLIYYIGNQALPIQSDCSLPVKIQDRFLLFQKDKIFVLEKNEIVQVFETHYEILGDYEVYPYSKWVSICDGGEDNWVYCYSYEDHELFERDFEKK